VFRPAITIHPGGKILTFGVLFFLPVFCFAIGMKSEVERSKSTAFCLSCHIIEPYGKSLHVDDPSFLAASHFQIIEYRRMKPAIPATPTTRCSVRLRPRWQGYGIFTSII
jgi:hypothetical protein